jgi:tetratricopeptide (TPR) repeat protein
MQPNLTEITSQLDNLLAGNSTEPKGYSIFNSETNGILLSDIFLPTNGLDYFYYLSYRGGMFLDRSSNPITLQDYRETRLSTEYLIELNYKKFPSYQNILIKEHDKLPFSSYKSPSKNNATEYLNKGYNEAENGNFTEAIEYYSKAIFEKPYDASLYHARAGAIYSLKQISSAIDDICRAGISNPISNQNVFTYAYQELAAVFMENNNYEDAARIYSIIIDNEGEDAFAIKNRAICYSKIGRHMEAINAIKSQLSNKKDIELYFALGEAYLNASLIQEAKIEFNNVINFTEGNNEIYRNMYDDMNKPTKEKARIVLNKLA